MTASPPSAPRLPTENLLRRRVTDFARQIREVIDELDRPQRQQLLRLLIEDVHVTGYQAKIRLRIPLDPQTPARPGLHPAPSPTTRPAVSSPRPFAFRRWPQTATPTACAKPEQKEEPPEQDLINPRDSDFYLATSGDRNPWAAP